MALSEAGWFNRAAIEIHASDASEVALARAGQRRYGPRSFRQLPEALRDTYFTRTPEKDEWTVNAGSVSAHHVLDPRQHRASAAKPPPLAGADVDLLPQPVYLFHAGDGPRGRGAPGAMDAGARLPLRRRGGVAAANRQRASNCKSLEERTCTSSHERTR